MVIFSAAGLMTDELSLCELTEQMDTKDGKRRITLYTHHLCICGIFGATTSPGRLQIKDTDDANSIA